MVTNENRIISLKREVETASKKLTESTVLIKEIESDIASRIEEISKISKHNLVEYFSSRTSEGVPVEDVYDEIIGILNSEIDELEKEATELIDATSEIVNSWNA